jgi:serine/threonine-protein kinase
MEPVGVMSPGASQMPTITTPAMTQAGMILGTAAYMSPEQAKGRTVDARADVWAFGVVLFEMLSGQRAFDGEDMTDVLGAVVRLEPRWEALPAAVPARVRQVLRACLQKPLKQRIAHIQDVRLALEGAFETAGPAAADGPVAPVAVPPLWRRALPFVATAAVVGVVAVGATWAMRPSDARPVIRSAHPLPDGRNFRSTGRAVVAVSPDGQFLVYNATGGLYLRPMDAVEDRVIPGTEPSVFEAVVSPDGQSVAYFRATSGSGAELVRVSVAGGAVVRLTTAREMFGLSWEPDGTLLYGQPDGIWQVSENGGEPQHLITTEAGEQASGPQRLPGGDWVLFTLARGDGAIRWDEAEIVAQSPSSGERRVLRTGGAGARYLSTGHLVYAFEATLFAVPFDVDRLAVTGGPVPVVQGVRRSTDTGAANFSVTPDGMLVYVPGTTQATGLAALGVFDRQGQVEPLAMPDGAYDYPRVSPDGRWVAYTATYSDGEDIAVYEIGSNAAPRRLTFGGRSRFPVWSADSARVVFQSTHDDAPGLFWQAVDGTGAAERLTTAEAGDEHLPDSASPDGMHLTYTVRQEAAEAVWLLTLASKDAAPLIVAPSARVAQSVFSPDGRWLAYQSTETGEDEIFVQPFPPSGAKYQLPNTRDNHHPLWSPDGRELFYVPGPGQYASVGITTEPRFAFGNPVSMNVNQVLTMGAPNNRRQIDIMPDGSGFLGRLRGSGDNEGVDAFRNVQIVQHWFEELTRLVPTP